MPPRKGKKKTVSLEVFADEEAKVRFTENQELARQNRTLRSSLAATKQELEAVQKRLAAHEHPSMAKVERLLGKRQSLNREEIAKELKIGLEAAAEILRDMSARGYNVVGDVVSRGGGVGKVEVEHFYDGDTVRFGVVSDTHLGNKHAMPEQLHEAYAVFKREGITQVYCPGNLIDGEKTYRGQEYEIDVMGADNVVAYLARTWPKIPGITTYHVESSTCHEGYYVKSAGLLIGKMIEAERPDMKYLGLDEADIAIHDSPARPILRIVHPGGGTSYADSYRPQKIVESYHGGEKPAILIIGHYHKGGYYDIRDVAVLQAMCLERQTPFMRKLSLRAVLGFWIVEATFTPDGSLRRFKPEAFRYYIGKDGEVLRNFEV